MANRIDFKYLKEQADFLVVLKHYGIDVSGRGTSRSIHCPFHRDKTASCKINLGRKGYHCFGCGAHGNILTFVQKKEGLDDDELRAAARKLSDICSIPLAPPAEHRATLQKPSADERSEAETIQEPPEGQTPRGKPHSASGQVSPAETRNEPLKPDFLERFQAKLQPAHDLPYLRQRGIAAGVIDTFELSFCSPASKSTMKGRVTFPIRNVHGDIVAFAGRWVGADDQLPEGQGKYALPAGFHKALELYNLHRVASRRHLVVVEGFAGVWRLFELGVPAVALMGSSLSSAQIALLRDSGARFLTFLLDGDDAGRSAVPAMMA